MITNSSLNFDYIAQATPDRVYLIMLKIQNWQSLNEAIYNVAYLNINNTYIYTYIQFNQLYNVLVIFVRHLCMYIYTKLDNVLAL